MVVVPAEYVAEKIVGELELPPKIFSWMRGCPKRGSPERTYTENKGFAGPFPGFEGGMKWLRKRCRSIPFKTITVKYFVKSAHRLTKNLPRRLA